MFGAMGVHKCSALGKGTWASARAGWQQWTILLDPDREETKIDYIPVYFCEHR